MPSNAQRGAAWKAKTRRLLASQGYVVVELELVRSVWTRAGKFATKRDQLGADLLGVSARGYVWVQVKGYTTTRPSLAAAKRKFDAYPLPPSTRRVIVLWKLRARAPEIIECS